MLERGDAAPDVTFARSGGDDVALSSFWREGPLVVAFLRHFG
jgi:peroxiredoxin